mmetsp:Transcript_4167/g.9266  ORF Transcript_4167/g.9266 Transcript_4167/m.9266 type:complete len:294 (-) Transcript_4167:40-921(-)
MLRFESTFLEEVGHVIDVGGELLFEIVTPDVEGLFQLVVVPVGRYETVLDVGEELLVRFVLALEFDPAAVECVVVALGHEMLHGITTWDVQLHIHIMKPLAPKMIPPKRPIPLVTHIIAILEPQLLHLLGHSVRVRIGPFVASLHDLDDRFALLDELVLGMVLANGIFVVRIEAVPLVPADALVLRREDAVDVRSPRLGHVDVAEHFFGVGVVAVDQISGFRLGRAEEAAGVEELGLGVGVAELAADFEGADGEEGYDGDAREERRGGRAVLWLVYHRGVCFLFCFCLEREAK